MDVLALLPATLDGLYGMVYALLAAAALDEASMVRALAIIKQLPDSPGRGVLPIREAQTLAMELLQKALERGLESTVLASPA